MADTGYYFNDPSGLGAWWVEPDKSPAQAIQDILDSTGATVSTLLLYSVGNNPDAQKVGGGKPSTATTTVNTTPAPGSVPPVRSKVIIKGNYTSSNTCPPGMVYDITSNQCIQVPDDVSCPDGFYYNQFTNSCDPINTNPPGGGGSGVSSSSNVPVTVTVNVDNAVTLAAGVGQAIGDAVNSAVADAIAQMQQAITQVTDDIYHEMETVTDGIGKTVNGLIGGIGDFFKYIGNLIISNVQNVVNLIKDNIGSLVSATEDVLNNVIIPVLKKIDTVITTINKTLNDTIVPIFNAISQTYNQTVALISAIKTDINNGINGLLQLPADIANSLAGIDATIQRGISQAGINKKGSADVALHYPENDSLWNRLEHIGRGITDSGAIRGATTTFADTVKLKEPSIADVMQQVIKLANHEGEEITATFTTAFKDIVAKLKEGFSGSQYIIGDLFEMLVWLAIQYGVYAAELFPLFYYVKNEANARVPLSKLGEADALNAWVRGFISDDDATAELSRLGYDATRIKTLKDLEHPLLEISTVIDMYFREIIQKDDLTDNVFAHGFNAEDREALIAQAYRRVDVHTATTAWRFKVIDDEALKAVLRQHRYTENEIALFYSTLLNHESVGDVIDRLRRTTFWANIGFSPASYSSVPDSVIDAATRDGIDATLATDHWQASFHIHSLQEWLRLYFRRIRTRKELDAAFDYYKVPQEFRDDFIRANQALIPWRTIPTLLANGFIDEEYAKNQLQGHGYDLQETEALLKYASIAHSKTKTMASGDLHSISVGNARTFFLDGAIDAAQYKQILLDHGYDDASANLTVQVETMQEHAKERRQIATDIVNEVLAGLISVDDAQSQMSANNFTASERAKVLRSIARTKKSGSKTPTESELRAMASKSIITVDDYREGLSVLGFTSRWVEAFVKLHFGSLDGSATT